MRLSYLLVEIAALVFFARGILESKKKNAGRLVEFVMIFFYGLLLEELDQRIFKSYHYSPDFFLTLGHVPIAIALLWAVILASSMAISDALGLPIMIRPFADALLAVWIDLSLDAIAIRAGFWMWSIPLNEGWFGVPAGNLYAWMWVAFFFSAWARVVRNLVERGKSKWIYLAIPFLAYVGLFIAMNALGFLGKGLGLTTQSQRLFIFWIQFLIFLLIVLWGWKSRRPSGEKVSGIWKSSRFAIHVYFLTLFLITGMFRALPILGAVALITLTGEQGLWRLLKPK